MQVALQIYLCGFHCHPVRIQTMALDFEHELSNCLGHEVDLSFMIIIIIIIYFFSRDSYTFCTSITMQVDLDHHMHNISKKKWKTETDFRHALLYVKHVDIILSLHEYHMINKIIVHLCCVTPPTVGWFLYQRTIYSNAMHIESLIFFTKRKSPWTSMINILYMIMIKSL